MRLVATALAGAAVLVTATACDPVTDRKYFREGVGVELYTSDGARQTELQNLYFDYICRQAGLLAETGTCGYQSFGSSAWRAIFEAGMNDIDQRCDAYLSWLDAQRRDRQPVLSQLSALNTATHTIMTVSGATPEALDIVTAAFGLATATYTNWNSRLLLAVNQSTVQEVVYSRQSQYRAAVRDMPVPDRPSVVYLLRNYLRICMPITIETEINTTTTLVQRGDPQRAKDSPVINPVRPSIIRDVNAPLRRFTPPRPAPAPMTRLGPFEPQMQAKDLRFVLDVLCRPGTETDLGTAGSPARKALSKFLSDNQRTATEILDRNAFIDVQELNEAGKKGC